MFSFSKIVHRSKAVHRYKSYLRIKKCSCFLILFRISKFFRFSEKKFTNQIMFGISRFSKNGSNYKILSFSEQNLAVYCFPKLSSDFHKMFRVLNLLFTILINFLNFKNWSHFKKIHGSNICFFLKKIGILAFFLFFGIFLQFQILF